MKALDTVSLVPGASCCGHTASNFYTLSNLSRARPVFTRAARFVVSTKKWPRTV